jgi:beta-lactamase regulating signal transducer with metallopeptidase domain/uncharacterized GH25 family protein
MSWMNELGSWLGYSAISCLLILALGTLAVRFCREPIYRIRIIQWTFVACLLVPIVQQFELLPGPALPIHVASDSSGATSTNIQALASESTPRSLAIEPETTLFPSGSDDFRLHASNIATEQWRHGAADSDQTLSTIQRTADAPTSQATRAPISVAWIVAILRVSYCALAVLIAIRWSIGFAVRRRIVSSSDPASEQVHVVLRSIGGSRAERVRLLTSEKIDSPVMWGIFRPTIVVPRAHATRPQSSQLRWGLAHEWCHVLRGDFLTHGLATITKLVCFFQPAFWWLKRELALSQDCLADAFAARQGDAAEYAAFLVSLARDRHPTDPAVGLGIGDGRSTLFKRIRILLQSPRPLLQTNRVSAMAIAAVGVAVIAGIGSVRLSAIEADAADTTRPVPQATDKQGDKIQEADEVQVVKSDTKPDVAPITYTGRVINRDSDEPIAGATVEIKRELSRDPKTGKWILLEITKHESDENGNYSFTLPPEQVAESSLYLEVNADHDEYQSKGWSGYSHSMIRTNLEKGDPPFYATIKLSPGEAITGVVARPDGTPIPGVQVGSYTKRRPTKDEQQDTFRIRGAFQNTETDSDGKFRMVVATPGDGVLWIHAADYASQAHRIGDKRGDMGTFTLQEGIILSGQVLDAKGNPVANVGVNLRAESDGEEADAFLNTNAVAGGIRGGTTTDENGRFRLKPLPPGTYRTKIEEVASDPTVKRGNWFERKKEKMPHVFAAMNIELAADDEPEPVVLQAMPHVIIQGRFFDGQCKPRASHGQHLFGRTGDTYFFTESTLPGKDGWFEFRVPHGITEAKINTMTNEHSALRWRLKGMKELAYGRQIPLGTLEADVDGLEIVRYSAPILLVKAVDTAGKSIDDFRVTSSYVEQPEHMKGITDRTIYTNGGDVNFEKQADGRWRSSQLLPDTEISIDATKEGFEAEPQLAKLKEKETRELTFVLSPAEEKPNRDASGELSDAGEAPIQK